MKTAVIRDLAQIRAQIEEFLKSAREPALLEPGEELLPLTAENYALEMRGSRLTLQAWDRTRNWSRRLTAITEATNARLAMTVERFARREGQMFLLDLGRRSGAELGKRTGRLVFRERFRLFLRRQFPEWTLAEVSAEADLEHSLSPAFPRAYLKHGQHGWAAIAWPPSPPASNSSPIPATMSCCAPNRTITAISIPTSNPAAAPRPTSPNPGSRSPLSPAWSAFPNTMDAPACACAASSSPNSPAATSSSDSANAGPRVRIMRQKSRASPKSSIARARPAPIPRTRSTASIPRRGGNLWRAPKSKPSMPRCAATPSTDRCPHLSRESAASSICWRWITPAGSPWWS